MKKLLIIRLVLVIALFPLMMACNGGGGGSDNDNRENNIYNHDLYLNSPPWSHLEKVPAGCEFSMRLDFEKFNADTYGLWFQAESEHVFIDMEPHFYELSNASVGKTLFWFLYEDTWVDVWLEMEDGSTSVVYSFLIEVADRDELGIQCTPVMDWDLDEWKEQQSQTCPDYEEEVYEED